MKYRLKIVKSYEAQNPTFYESGNLADYELDPVEDILNVSTSIQSRTTVYQAQADFFRIGSIRLRLNASLSRWIPGSGWLQSDRDHILTVTTDTDDVIWRGYATEVKLTSAAGAEWKFTAIYNRLDDVQIAGDDDENRSAVAAQDILDELYGQLPDLWPVVDASGWFDVFRPDENTSARDYVSRLLTAQGKILVVDAMGDLEVRDIAPRTTTFDHAAGLAIRAEDGLIRVRIDDEKKFMYNTITYSPHGRSGDPIVYQGELETYIEPGNFIYRYGRREIQMDFDHLSEADAATAAEAWQGRLIRPRPRATVELPNPERQILLLQRVQFQLDHIADVQIPFWIDAVVVAVKINVVADTVEIEAESLNEIT